MTPIEKNITVVDEHGYKYEATYPKRAKGLVKNGRARFIDENTICLACPPGINTEDNIMSENINLTADETTVENAPERFTLDYCLEQLEKLAVQTEYLNQAISEILESESVPISAAMVDIVKFRETTNQRLISFYEKMYEDLKPQKAEKYAPEPNLILGDMMQLIKDPDSTAEQMSFASSIIEKYLDKKF